MWLHTASIESTVGNKTTKLGFILVRSTFSTSSSVTLAGAFRSNHVAACSTALRSATEENASGGYVTFRVRPKWSSVVAQRIGWNSSDVTRLVTTEHIQKNIHF